MQLTSQLDMPVISTLRAIHLGCRYRALARISSVKREDEEAIAAGSPTVYYAAGPFKGSALLHLGANANHKGKNHR
jgi:hypothetical protein